RLLSSSTEGPRHPFCPPTSLDAQRSLERLHTSCSRSGSCSQISPVWLSLTAAPFITRVKRPSLGAAKAGEETHANRTTATDSSLTPVCQRSWFRMFDL